MTDDDTNGDSNVSVHGAEYPSREDRRPLLANEHVIGHGIGYREVGGERTDEVCVTVYVDEKLPEDFLDESEVVPKDCAGVKTDVIERPDISVARRGARDEDLRPVIGGTETTAGDGIGSLGGTYWDPADGHPAIVSSTHVWGDLEDSPSQIIGTDVYQPGNPFPGNRVGEVYKSSNTSSQAERSDIAYAEPSTSVSTYAFGMGEIIGIEPPELGVRYMRSSINTGLIGGLCTSIDMTVSVEGVTFHNLFETDTNVISGDSGSITGYVVPSGDIVATGITMAGSDDTEVTIHTPLSKAASDSGLTPLEPLVDHTDKVGVEQSPPDNSDFDEGYIEAHPRRVVDNNGSSFAVEILVVNTGGYETSDTIRIETVQGTGISNTQDVTLLPNQYEVYEFFIGGEFEGHRVRAYTNDMAGDLSDWSRFEFTVSDEDALSGYPDSDYEHPSWGDENPWPPDGGGGDDPPDDPDPDPPDDGDPWLTMHGSVDGLGGYPSLHAQFLIREAEDQS